MKKSQMKITVVVGEFPKRSETFVLDQVLYLIRAGHKVEILCERLGDESILDESHLKWLSEAKVHQWPAPSSLLVRPLPWRFREAVRRLQWAWTLKLSGPDVILAHFGWNAAQVAPLLSRGKPALVTIYHGNDVAVPWQKNRMADFAELFRHGALHLPVNGSFAELLMRAGVPSENVHVHHLGVPIEKYVFRAPNINGKLRLLSVCRLVEKKGIATAVLALKLLNDRYPELEWSYDIGGEGPEEEALRGIVEKANLEDRVTFLGPISHDEVLSRMAGADIVLQPSVTAADGDQEGIPVVLMEAAAIGSIICSTRHSGIPELVEDMVTGLLADEHDAKGLADNLRRIAVGELDLQSLAQAARKKVETDFSESKQNESLLQHLRNACGG